MNRNSIAALVTGASMVLAACGGGGTATDQSLMPAPETPPVPQISYSTIKYSIPIDTTVEVLDDENRIIGIMIGNTLVQHRLGSVRGTFQRPTIGDILQDEDTSQDENVRVRNVHSHWNMTTDEVSRYSYMEFGAWSKVAPKVDGNAQFDYRYESIGGSYLASLNGAATPVANLPTSGGATYTGQVTGFLQGHGVDGQIGKFDGDVDIIADFLDASITMDMVSTRGNSLVLTGSIQGNTFSGTHIERMSDTPVLQAEGAMANMKGGFFGVQAGEAGGVFEIVGGRAQNPGRMFGAFGGKKPN